MTRCGKLLLALGVGLGLGFVAGAGQAGELQPGRDFRQTELSPATPGKSRIEVTEFFWYGCPHCAELEPLLTRWVAGLPADVHFRRVPAVLSGKWVSGARLYYTLEALHLVATVHPDVFTAIHRDRLRLLDDEDALFAWAASEGIDRQRFAAAWNAAGLQDRVREAHRLAQTAGIGGVPALIIDGRYQALTDGSYSDLLQRADQLIARARHEAAGEK